jgi:hypothetical protein
MATDPTLPSGLAVSGQVRTNSHELSGGRSSPGTVGRLLGQMLCSTISLNSDLSKTARAMPSAELAPRTAGQLYRPLTTPSGAPSKSAANM